MKNLLLHICCAPCSLHVWEKLSADYDLHGFFFNPNIQPRREYEFRRRELEKVAAARTWPVHYGGYDSKGWRLAVRGLEQEPERGQRCPVCFRFRLEATFRHAQDAGFEAVATTLSISPHKITEQINVEGRRLADEYRLFFVAENFKKENGFVHSCRLSAELGIRHQDYCGCRFSLAEKRRRRRSAAG